jgi:two-component system, cell cycle response regulator CpdR
MAHILIAEDDQSMCQFLGSALERAGHRVTLTYDGIEALKALDGPEAFDLLLADIVMPGMDGIELSQCAVEKRPGLKVMFITGFTAVAMGASNPALKTARVLSKPFHLNDLVQQVEAHLAQPA